MKFYNRNSELNDIKNILDRKESDFVYIYGRRRIGKTSLILKAVDGTKFLYLFVGDKSKKELLNEFNEIIKTSLNISYLNFENFREMLNFLFDYSKQNKLVLIFDEFQNFFNIDKGIFSDFQYFWDLNNKNINLKLFCLGSHFTLMKEIFENNKNPLFGRKTASFYLKEFNIETQIEILKDFNSLSYTNLLYFYSIFAGVPKYIEIFFKNFNDSKSDFIDKILDNFIKENSFFFYEGKELFLIEFGRSHDTYFSILGAISLGKNRKNEISQFTGISTDSLGFYLQKLESYFEIIERKIPIGEKKSTKVGYYSIKDKFLIFWFRYINKYNYLLEIKNFDKLRDFIKKDINIFLGFSLEKLMKDVFIELNLRSTKILPFEFDKIGNFFNKSGIEIDIVLLNKKENKVLFIESKLSGTKINARLLFDLKEKVEKTGIFKNYKKYYGFVSLKEISFDFSNDDYIFKYSMEEFLKIL